MTTATITAPRGSFILDAAPQPLKRAVRRAHDYTWAINRLVDDNRRLRLDLRGAVDESHFLLRRTRILGVIAVAWPIATAVAIMLSA